jgi:hypothetical protein
VEAALAAYEMGLFPRSQAAAADARVILDLCLGDRAPFGLVGFFKGTLRQAEEQAVPPQ